MGRKRWKEQVGFRSHTQASIGAALSSYSLLYVGLLGIIHVGKMFLCKEQTNKTQKTKYKSELTKLYLPFNIIRHNIITVSSLPTQPFFFFLKNGNCHFQWLLLHALLKVKKKYTKCLPLASNYKNGWSSDSVC